MISPTFLQSRFIKENDLLQLLVKANEKGCQVFCLFLKPLGSPKQIYTLEQQQLPVTLLQKVVDFLLSIPNIDDSNTQRTLIHRAGLDSQLHQQITFGGSPAQFFQLLVPILRSYGLLEDGRDALAAVLESAKTFVGQDKREYCDTLTDELHRYAQDTLGEGELIQLTTFQNLNSQEFPLSTLTDADRTETLVKCAEKIVRQTRNISNCRT